MSSVSLTTRLVPTLAAGAVAAALALTALLPGQASAAAPDAQRLRPPDVPELIRAPAGNVPFLLGHALGTQDYACKPTADGYAWTLVAPAATLFDDRGKRIATHYAGPTWRANDGSTVVGAKVNDGLKPSPSAIAWLLLRATSTTVGPDGERLTATTYIQRVNTTDGLAPASGCDATSVGATASVPYTADYYFYRSAESE